MIKRPIIGQQAVVYRSAFVGMVVDFRADFPHEYIRVRHPITGVECNYAPHNVTLIPLPEPPK